MEDKLCESGKEVKSKQLEEAKEKALASFKKHLWLLLAGFLLCLLLTAYGLDSEKDFRGFISFFLVSFFFYSLFSHAVYASRQRSIKEDYPYFDASEQALYIAKSLHVPHFVIFLLTQLEWVILMLFVVWKRFPI